MNKKPIESARDPDLRAIPVALHRAASRAREVAARTGTALIISHDGRLETVRPEPADTTATLQEPATGYADKP